MMGTDPALMSMEETILDHEVKQFGENIVIDSEIGFENQLEKDFNKGGDQTCIWRRNSSSLQDPAMSAISARTSCHRVSSNLNRRSMLVALMKLWLIEIESS